MPSELSIACSLGADELPRRLAEMSAVGHDALFESQASDGRAVLRFRAGARERLAGIVAAEAECCSFLDMKLDEDSGVVQLTIEAPAGAEAVLEDLVAAFQGERSTPSGA